MKVGDYEVPEGLYYTKYFGWVRIEGDKIRMCITDARATAMSINYLYTVLALLTF